MLRYSSHVSKKNARLRHTFDPGRLGFLFIADGSIEAQSELSGEMIAQDAVRMENIERLVLHGRGIAVLWDVPAA
jgi:hypothetical protein